MNKLVRGLIPDIIRRDGRIPEVEQISDPNEFFKRLLLKLHEEVKEFESDESLEELADILEVVHTLSYQIGATPAQLDTVRKAKAITRGDFMEGLVVVEVSQAIDPPRIFVVAGTHTEAVEYCREEGIPPEDKNTVLVGGPQSVRGQHIKFHDRVIFVGTVWGRKDYPEIRGALTIAGAIPANSVWVNSESPMGRA